jgi:DNA-binding LacI/PurR family transcriptional regulator
MPTTNKDVAKQAGVSIATVSRVINGLPNVSADTRRKVLRAIKALNYQPSRTAQRLRAKRSRVLGVIISDIENPFFTSVVRGIEDFAYERGYSLVLCDSDEDGEKERLYIDVLRAEGVAGVILAPTARVNSHLANLIAHGIPVVAIDRPIEDLGVDSVSVANAEGAFQAVEHLLRLGHRRIGLVSMQFIPTGRERRAGYLRALHQYDIHVSHRLIRLGLAKPEAGYECARQLLQLAPRPTALFVDDNMMMLGVLAAIRDGGLCIPDDISVVGFDDMPWAPLLQPALTVVAQPTYELGRQAAEHLLERLAQPDKPVIHELLTPKLIVRASTTPPMAHSAAAVSSQLVAQGAA